MKEIEVKFKLGSGESFYSVINTLHDRYGFNAQQKIQQDAIYLLPEQMDRPIVEGSKIARVRTVTMAASTNSFMTLKVQTNRALVSTEFEFGISDPDVAKAFLENMGFQQSVVVCKKRAEAQIVDYTICVDEVEKLGVFIELEVLVQSHARVDMEHIQQQMKQFLEQLGLEGEVSMIPYDTQVREHDREFAAN